MLKMRGLRIIKKEKIIHEINFKSSFSKEDKQIIKEYIHQVMQTDYNEKCVNVKKQDNGLIVFTGNNKHLICELYLSEIKYLI